MVFVEVYNGLKRTPSFSGDQLCRRPLFFSYLFSVFLLIVITDDIGEGEGPGDRRIPLKDLRDTFLKNVE